MLNVTLYKREKESIKETYKDTVIKLKIEETQQVI